MTDIKIREVSTITIPNSGYTHGGIFHADELFCTALFRILNPEFKVTRGFNPEESNADVIYDIGGGEFDHHGEPEFRDDGAGVPYASFGKVWRKYGCLFLNEAGQKRFDRQFVERLDAHDNGGARNQLSEVISSLNPNWDDPTEKPDTQFQIALDFVQGILERQIVSAQAFERLKASPMMQRLRTPPLVSSNILLRLSVIWPVIRAIRSSWYILPFGVAGMPRSSRLLLVAGIRSAPSRKSGGVNRKTISRTALPSATTLAL